MLYLLDANTLIDAKRDYYGIDRVPEFWDWLVHHGQLENIKIPVEVYEEFADQKDGDGNKDALASWAEQADVQQALKFEEDADPDLVSRITYGGYVKNPTDDQLVTIGRVPFLISTPCRTRKTAVLSRRRSQSRQGSPRTVTSPMSAPTSVSNVSMASSSTANSISAPTGRHRHHGDQPVIQCACQ